MSLIIMKRSSLMALAGAVSLLSALPTAEAQYRRPVGYGYNTRRSGWRNIYLVAIILPVIFFALVVLLWFCVFRAIFRRRRQRNANVLPSHNPNASYPTTEQYPNQYGNGVGGGYDNNYNSNNNNGTYNYGQQDMTQYPQQAHVSSGNNYDYSNGQQQYAPPAGKPPQAY